MKITRRVQRCNEISPFYKLEVYKCTFTKNTTIYKLHGMHLIQKSDFYFLITRSVSQFEC